MFKSVLGTHHPGTPTVPTVLHPQQSLLHRLGDAAHATHGHKGVGVEEIGRQVLDAGAEGGAEHGRLPAFVMGGIGKGWENMA